MAGTEGFNFGLLPTLCQDEVIKRANIGDLINMMEDNPELEEQIKNRKIQSGGYHLKFTHDGGIKMPKASYEWKWQRLDRRFMVEDIIKQFNFLKERFPGEVTVLEVEKHYLPAFLDNGTICRCKKLIISNGYAGNNVTEATMIKFFDFMEITEKLQYGITMPRLRVDQIKDIPVVNLHYAGWLRAPDLMKMNSIYLQFDQAIYTSEQLNEFLKKWYNSENPHLTKATFSLGEELDEDIVFQGLYKKPWDPENKNRTDFPRPPADIAEIIASEEPAMSFLYALFSTRDMSNCFELRRPDGLLASIDLKGRQFVFKVHWTPLKNTSLQDGYTADIQKCQAKIDKNNEYMARKRNAPDGLVVNLKKPRVEGEEQDPEVLEKERLEKEKKEHESKMEDWVLMAENLKNQIFINSLKASFSFAGNAL